MTEFRTRRLGSLKPELVPIETSEDRIVALQEKMDEVVARGAADRAERIWLDCLDKTAAALPWHADMDIDDDSDSVSATIHGAAIVESHVISTGPMGGNHSHGGFTTVRIEFPAGGVFSFEKGVDGCLIIDVKGDDEGMNLGHALKFAGTYITERFKKNVE